VKRTFTFVTVLCLIFGLHGCKRSELTSDSVQRQKQEALSQQGNAIVGMPSIVNFAEKRQLKDLLELRDKTPPTYVYIVDMNGRLHKICDAVGYGFSGATQFTNPQRTSSAYNANGYAMVTLPQADPNGLFSPSTDEGTWIMCKNPKGTDVAPVRIELRAIISPFALD
jgi:hypothetical protein